MDSARGCTVRGLSYFTQSEATFFSSSTSAKSPGSYIMPRDIPAAPCLRSLSRRSSICSSSAGVSLPGLLPDTLALAEQWPVSSAMLQGMFLSVAFAQSSKEAYSPVVSSKWKSPAPTLSRWGVPSEKPIAEMPQLPATKVVIPCLMKGSKYFLGFFLMANQSLWECPSIKPGATDWPVMSITVSAVAGSISGLTEIMRSSSYRTLPIYGSAPVPS